MVRIQLEIGRSGDAVNAVADGTADLGVVDVAGRPFSACAPSRSGSRSRNVMMPADHALTA